MKKDLLKLLDLTGEEILKILDTADQLKFSQKHGIPHDKLKGKTLAMIFEKNSTRTRVSFETGMYQLGGHALFLSGKESQIGRGEPVEDTARVLLRYCDGIMIRTFAQEEVETLAAHANIPVINGLTDFCHPCQVLADLMTVREHKAVLEGLKMCYIGDGNNMANSLIVGGQSLHLLLGEGADHNAVTVAQEHPGGVLHRLPPADLALLARQEQGVPPQLVHTHLEGHPGAGGVLLKDHGQGLAPQLVVGQAVLLAVLHLVRRVQDLVDVLGGQVQQL